MAIQLLSLTQMDTGKWYARLLNDATGQTVELKYASKPSAAQAKADVAAAFNPPTKNYSAEDGTVVAVPLVAADLDLSLTTPQKTAIDNALTTLTTLVNKITGKLPADADVLAQLRAHSPRLDALLGLVERLR